MIRRNLTILALLISSADFTARCNGVIPDKSFAFGSAPQASKNYTEFSEPA